MISPASGLLRAQSMNFVTAGFGLGGRTRKMYLESGYLNFLIGAGEQGTPLTFTEWNEAFEVEEPEGAVDVSGLPGLGG